MQKFRAHTNWIYKIFLSCTNTISESLNDDPRPKWNLGKFPAPTSIPSLGLEFRVKNSNSHELDLETF